MMGFGVAFIVAIELCERMGFYGITGTMKNWLQDQGYSNAQSTSLNAVFAMLSYITCFIGGWLAGTRVGRYWTILVLSTMYAIGCLLTSVAAHPDVESVPLYFVGAFVLIALGTGGIKPNVCTFGADQIDPQDPAKVRKTESFFMYFYFTVNLGAMVAFGLLATTATNGLPPLIPIEDGFFATYMFCSGLMILVVMLFVLGT